MVIGMAWFICTDNHCLVMMGVNLDYGEAPKTCGVCGANMRRDRGWELTLEESRKRENAGKTTSYLSGQKEESISAKQTSDKSDSGTKKAQECNVSVSSGGGVGKRFVRHRKFNNG